MTRSTTIQCPACATTNHERSGNDQAKTTQADEVMRLGGAEKVSAPSISPDPRRAGLPCYLRTAPDESVRLALFALDVNPGFRVVKLTAADLIPEGNYSKPRPPNRGETKAKPGIGYQMSKRLRPKELLPAAVDRPEP